MPSPRSGLARCLAHGGRRRVLLSFERPAGETLRLRPFRTLKTAQHGHEQQARRLLLTTERSPL